LEGEGEGEGEEGEGGGVEREGRQEGGVRWGVGGACRIRRYMRVYQTNTARYYYFSHQLTISEIMTAKKLIFEMLAPFDEYDVMTNKLMSVRADICLGS
jgi:hypothetical protein